MRVDRATLSDLSILDPDAEGVSLFALLERTVSDLGRSALRQRMREPLSSTAAIRDTQDAIRYVAAQWETTRHSIVAIDPDAVDRYLSLKWQAARGGSPVARFIDRLSLRLRYGDAIRQIGLGVSCLRALFDGLSRLADIASRGPSLLNRYAARLEQVGDDAVIQDVRRYAAGRSLPAILDADRLARGPARDGIRQILGIVAELDALCGLARATTEHQWCFPELVDDTGVLTLQGLHHPFLVGAVANDLALTDRQRVLALTGPNMAGKSTVLKAAGIAVYLAHLGCGVPARHARVSRFDVLLASLNVRDRLMNGQSFYLSEVRRIRDLVTELAATPRVFALLDEPFRGTNIPDATEATTLLVDGLCAQVASTVIVATHLATVVRSRAADPGLASYFLSATENESGPTFDYRLQHGISEQRLGMVLLEREGVTPALRSAIQRRGTPVPSV